MWTREEWVSHVVDEKDESFVLTIVRDFVRKLDALAKEGSPLPNNAVSDIEIEKNETIAGEATVIAFFKTGEIHHAFKASGFMTDEYKKFTPQTWELLFNMMCAPARITPYGLDYALRILRKVMPDITFEKEYYCNECQNRFDNIKDFMVHLQSTRHKNETVLWFPSFFQ